MTHFKNSVAIGHNIALIAVMWLLKIGQHWPVQLDRQAAMTTKQGETRLVGKVEIRCLASPSAMWNAALIAQPSCPCCRPIKRGIYRLQEVTIR